MKLNNKLKLSLIAIATLTTANVNAQTLYSCIPEGCPAGQYFDGKKCIALCPSGYGYSFSRCCKENKYTEEYLQVDKNAPAPVSYKGQKAYKNSNEPGYDSYHIKLSYDDYVDYVNQYTGKKMRKYGRCSPFGYSFLSSNVISPDIELDP